MFCNYTTFVIIDILFCIIMNGYEMKINSPNLNGLFQRANKPTENDEKQVINIPEFVYLPKWNQLIGPFYFRYIS